MVSNISTGIAIRKKRVEAYNRLRLLWASLEGPGELTESMCEVIFSTYRFRVDVGPVEPFNLFVRDLIELAKKPGSSTDNREHERRS